MTSKSRTGRNDQETHLFIILKVYLQILPSREIYIIIQSYAK